MTVTLVTEPPAPLNQMPYNAALPHEPTGWVCVNPVPMIVRFSTFIDVPAFVTTAPLNDPVCDVVGGDRVPGAIEGDPVWDRERYRRVAVAGQGDDAPNGRWQRAGGRRRGHANVGQEHSGGDDGR